MSRVAFYKVPVGSTLILGDAHACVLAKDGGFVTVEMHESGEHEQYSMDWIQENLRNQTFHIKTPADEFKRAELENYTGGVLLAIPNATMNGRIGKAALRRCVILPMSALGRLCWADPTRLGGQQAVPPQLCFEPFVSVLGFMLHDGHPSGCLPISAALSAHGRLGGGVIRIGCLLSALAGQPTRERAHR